MSDPNTFRSDLVTGRTPTGIIFAVLAAATLGLTPIGATLFYQAGGGTETFVAVRMALGAVGALALVLITGHSFHVPRPARSALLWSTLGALTISYCYMASVRYVPVALAALLFYTFPIAVLAVTRLLGDQTPLKALILSALGAFLGLSLALSPALGELDWRGVILALGAAGGACLQIFASERALARGTSSLPLTFYVNLAGLPVAFILMMATGGIDLAPLQTGWASSSTGRSGMGGLALGAFGLLFGLLFQFLAVARAGAPRVAVILNLEPIVTIGLGVVILSQAISLQQATGAALVLLSVGIAGRVGLRMR